MRRFGVRCTPAPNPVILVLVAAIPPPKE